MKTSVGHNYEDICSKAKTNVLEKILDYGNEEERS